MSDATAGSSPAKERVVIVGAGPAGLSTAFHLTDPVTNPEWQTRYEVDVYQLGWRVGGKGATGRNPDAGERLQEHGIHVFGNMYFNSFRMMGTCFAEVEWDEHDQHRTLETAFLPSLAQYESEYWDGKWHGQLGNFPDNGSRPWEGEVWPGSRGIVMEVLNVIHRHLGDAMEGRHTPGPKVRRWNPWAWFKRWLERRTGDVLLDIFEDIERHQLEERLHPRPPSHEHHDEVLHLLERALAHLANRFAADSNHVGRRVAYIDADLVVTTFRGVLKDDLVVAGVDSIDGENYREWLQRHGASTTTLDAGAPQALPNTSLAYQHGDTTQIPTMSAAAFVTFFLRQLSGKGSGAYFFAEGTGETIMKPLYRLLTQRGVRFHFFHKLADVAPGPGPTATTIDTLTFDVQATVSAGATAYEPMRRMADGELVWPDRPLYDQLAEGSSLAAGDELPVGGYDLESWWTAWAPVGQRVLRRGQDFDRVVLATPISTLEHTCPSVIAHPTAAPTWGPMVANVASAATQAVQLWIDVPTTELGWPKPPGPTDRFVGALYNQDLTSFCDFSDLIDQERWPADDKPKALLYLIGALSDPEVIPPFTDHDFPKRQHERIKWATIQWLRTVDGLLPKASTSPIDPRSFGFERLHAYDPAHRGRGVNQFDQQFWKANIDPNERYTLNVAGTIQYRLDAWASGFENLVLAGDWIYTGFNVGSFEGAVMSGKLASFALTGAPSIEEVYGFTFLHAHRDEPTTFPLPLS
jgi:uncharacterized protein with NAD-binding domain and iron-sulfur cluster